MKKGLRNLQNMGSTAQGEPVYIRMMKLRNRVAANGIIGKSIQTLIRQW